VLRRRVWSRNIKNGCSIYIYDISRLRVNLGSRWEWVDTSCCGALHLRKQPWVPNK